MTHPKHPRRRAPAWDATGTPSLALRPLLQGDEAYAARQRALEARRAAACAEIAAERAEAARRERERQEERERRRRQMAEDERRAIANTANMVRWRRRVS